MQHRTPYNFFSWPGNYFVVFKLHCPPDVFLVGNRYCIILLHQQEFHFAPGAPGASEAPGAPSANRNSGCVVAYSFRPDAYPARPGAPDAPGCQPPASSIFSQPLTFVDVLSCLLSSSRTLLILAPLRLLSASSPPLIPFSLRIRPQSAPFPDAIHPLPYPSPFTP